VLHAGGRENGACHHLPKSDTNLVKPKPQTSTNHPQLYQIPGLCKLCKLLYSVGFHIAVAAFLLLVSQDASPKKRQESQGDAFSAERPAAPDDSEQGAAGLTLSNKDEEFANKTGDFTNQIYIQATMMWILNDFNRI
jgi:hypothetical protein